MLRREREGGGDFAQREELNLKAKEKVREEGRAKAVYKSM